MRSTWFALILCCAWFHSTTGLVGPPSPSALWPLIFAFLLLSLARGKEDDPARSWPSAWLVLPWIAFLLLVGLPLGIGAAIYLAALAWTPLGKRIPRLRFVAPALSQLGVLLTFQLLGVWGYWTLGPRLPAARWLLEPIASVLRLLGVDAGVSAASLHVVFRDAVATYTPAYEHLGLFAALLLFAGAIPLLWLNTARPWRSAAILAGALCAYCLVRYLALLLTFRFWREMTVFWEPTPTLFSFLPLGLLLHRLVPLTRLDRSPIPSSQGVPTPRAALRLGASALVAVLGTTVALTFQDPGQRKAGRILFDEHHSDWEWTDEPLDTKTYGFRTTYNYYNLLEYLDSIWNARRSREPLTAAVLEDCDVLVLKMPTTPYAPSEVETIVRYVENGGGLWLIGDHTNVFGSSTYLNAVAERFGMHFRFDCEYELQTGGLNLYRAPDLAPHSIAAQLPPFLFATSCTLQCALGVESVMTGNGLRVVPGDYSNRNFFPRSEEFESRDYRFGPFCQSASTTLGKGRVLAFADSTVFSNFFMFLPGKPELARASIEWLNRTNALRGLRPLLCLIALAALAGAVATGRRMIPQWTVTLALAGGLLGVTLGLLAARASTTMGFSLQSFREPPRYVAFDTEHSSLFLPYERLQVPGDNDYSTFYTWIQRLGLTPIVQNSLEAGLAEAEAIVIGEPRKPFEPEELQATVRYVERGGGLLVMEFGAPEGSGSTTDQVTGAFGMSLGDPLAPEETLEVPYANVALVEARAVVGGTPLVRTTSGTPVVSWSPVGEGVVIVCGMSKTFWADHMGTVSTIPQEAQQAIYELEYSLIRKVTRSEDLGIAGGVK